MTRTMMSWMGERSNMRMRRLDPGAFRGQPLMGLG